MKLVIDSRVLKMYSVGKPGFKGGTETYLNILAQGLAEKGHTVHVVTPDLDVDEQRGPNLFYWTKTQFPTNADAVIAFHNLEAIDPYHADILVLAPNGVDPWLGPDGSWGEQVDGIACFSQCHIDLLAKTRPSIDPAKCFVTGLGVDIEEYSPIPHPRDRKKVPYRMLYANDPARGLWHLLQIFEKVQQSIPEATLHVAYDFDRQFEHHRWESNYLAEMLWDCKRMMATIPNVTNVGGLDHDGIIREQMECHVHVMPSDPPNLGSQIHGITQAELAAAGTPLILSDTEAFPEVFGTAALVLPLPGTYMPELQRRYDYGDWAEAVVQVMQDKQRWTEMSAAARTLAESMTWDVVIDNWHEMLQKLDSDVKAKREQVAA